MGEVRHVKQVGEHTFGVRVVEGGELETHHLVRISPALLDDLGLFDVDGATVAREAVDFVLDRELPTSIPAEVSLEDLGRGYGEEFYDELRRRLAATT